MTARMPSRILPSVGRDGTVVIAASALRSLDYGFLSVFLGVYLSLLDFSALQAGLLFSALLGGGTPSNEVARWPAEGLRAYRKAVEPAAQKLLSEARGRLDIDALTTVLGRYFSTESAIPAAVALAEIHLESGRPAQARMI